MEDEEETKKHSKVITFSSPNNRSTKLLKNQKRFMKMKLKQQKTPLNNNTGNNAYEKRRTQKKDRKLLPFD